MGNSGGELLDFSAQLRCSLDNIKETFGFDAAAIRVVDPLGYMPFVVYSDLSASFIEDECLITVNDCACGRVLRGDTPRIFSSFTKHGSFWTNSLKPSEELEKIGLESRGRCFEEGFKTLCISPIKTESGIDGNLYLASREESLLTRKQVDIIEHKAIMIGENIFKKMRECDKYSNIIRLVAKDNGENKRNFIRYMKHIEHCPHCHTFYSQHLEFDGLVQKSMTLVHPPPELGDIIIQKIQLLKTHDRSADDKE